MVVEVEITTTRPMVVEAEKVVVKDKPQMLVLVLHFKEVQITMLRLVIKERILMPKLEPSKFNQKK